MFLPSLPEKRAEKCLEMHRDSQSTATVFDVIEFEGEDTRPENFGEAVRIDLSEGE